MTCNTGLVLVPKPSRKLTYTNRAISENDENYPHKTDESCVYTCSCWQREWRGYSVMYFIWLRLQIWRTVLFALQAQIALTYVGWRKDAVLSNPKLVPACLLMSLITWTNLTPKRWTFTSTQVVTPVKNYKHSLITRQPPVIRHVSASRSLGSTVTWARAITTSPTDVTWDRS